MGQREGVTEEQRTPHLLLLLEVLVLDADHRRPGLRILFNLNKGLDLELQLACAPY